MAEVQMLKCKSEICGKFSGEEQPGALCATCVQYANQDFVPQRETTMPGSTIDKINPSDLLINLSASVSKPKAIPNLDKMFREAKLTRQQRKVLKLYLFEGKTFVEIGKLLGITRHSAFRHHDRAIRKSQKRLASASWVKDLAFKNLETSPKDGVAIGPDNTSETIDPYQFYSACGECGHWDLQVEENGGSCVACGWEFIVK